MYICWSQSPLPFHPLTPPWCLYVCSHNRVSISALQIGLSVQFFWILHKCINIYLVFFFWLASVFMIVCSPSMSLQMTYLHSFYDWVIFHCIYVPHLLYPFLCWWTFRLLPCPYIHSLIEVTEQWGRTLVIPILQITNWEVEMLVICPRTQVTIIRFRFHIWAVLNESLSLRSENF